MIADAITPAIVDSVVGSIGGAPVVPPAASPIARLAQAGGTSSPISITLPGGANTLLEVFLSSGLATPGTYTLTIGGVSVPLHTSISHASGEPELNHYYVNSSAFQALSGTQSLVISGSLASNPDVLVRVLSNVDEASPIADVQKYEINEDTSIIPLTTTGAANNFVSMYVVHDLGRTWDTFTGVSEAYVGVRAAAGEHAMTAAGSFTGSIAYSVGNTHVRKGGLLIQYNAA